MILTDGLDLQRGPPVRQLAKLRLQAVHQPLPLRHHSLQLVLDPAHYLSPDPVQRGRHFVQKVLDVTSFFVGVVLNQKKEPSQSPIVQVPR